MSRSRHQDPSSCARRRSCPLPAPEPPRTSGGRRSVSTESMIRRTGKTMQMRSFTDIFIKHPVLAIVVNLMIVLAGWRALTTLPVQQYPKIESSSVIITTVYYGASAETVRGFLSTPIERVASAIGGVDYVESHEPWRREHGHGAFEIKPQQHGGVGRGDSAASTSALRAAGRSRAAGRRSAARRSALRLLLSELHLQRADRPRGEQTGCCARCSRNSRRCRVSSG